ncbi:hypothetical protein EON83_26465 [bacterium]|nr:MAG: hypothetical protein EON83_26465 [bacterium]
MPYTPTRPALPEVPPPLQIEPAELKRRLGFVEPRPRPISDADDMPSATENWSALLLEVARAGNIALELCSPLQIADLRAFGQWWLTNHPRLDLSINNFASAYDIFLASKHPG